MSLFKRMWWLVESTIRSVNNRSMMRQIRYSVKRAINNRKVLYQRIRASWTRTPILQYFQHIIYFRWFARGTQFKKWNSYKYWLQSWSPEDNCYHYIILLIIRTITILIGELVMKAILFIKITVSNTTWPCSKQSFGWVGYTQNNGLLNPSCFPFDKNLTVNVSLWNPARDENLLLRKQVNNSFRDIMTIFTLKEL